MRSRESKIDNLKCFAMYLVILGHSIQSINLNYNENILYRIIYSFHMPLFIFLSGFTTYKSKEDLNLFFIVKKIKSLLIPFISWALFSSFIVYKFNLIKNLYNILDILYNPDKGLWFLWSLFFINIFYYVSKKITNKISFLFIIYLFFLFLIYFFKLDNKFELKQTTFLIPFFIFGYLTKKHEEKIRQFINTKYLFLISFSFYSIIYVLFKNKTFDFYSLFILKNISAIIGCLFFYSLFSGLNIKSNFLQNIGKITIGIYAVHFYILNFLYNKIFGQDVYLLIYLPIVILFISYYISRILKRIKIFSFLFLGQ